MEGAESCGKSVTSEQEEAKPECEEGEVMMMQEQDGGAAAAAGEAMAPAQIDVRMDVALLHCQACLLPLKPPCSGTSAGTYHGVAEHKRVCPRIPCTCPQPDCAFLGPPAALL